MSTRIDRIRRLTVVGLGALVAGVPARGQPGERMKFIIPNAAGGSADRIGRTAARALAKILETSIDVVNIPGGGGVPGTTAIAASNPDGLTLGLAVSQPMIARQLLSSTVKYNPTQDFEWLAILGTYPNALLIDGRRPERTLVQWLAFARSSEKPLVVGTFGVGTSGHLATGFLRLDHRANLEHRVVETTEEGYALLAGGQIDVLFDGVPNAIASASKAGHRILAVTSLRRDPALPDVVAFGEYWPNSTFGVWLGIVAPSGLNPIAYTRLTAAIGVLLLDPQHAADLRLAGMTFLGLAGSAADAYVEADIVRSAKLIARLSVEREPRR